MTRVLARNGSLRLHLTPVDGVRPETRRKFMEVDVDDEKALITAFSPIEAFYRNPNNNIDKRLRPFIL